MDLEQQGDNLAGHAGGVQWPSAMSSFMLKYLAQLVASGTKTSTGFKQVHYNGCARALKESLNFHVTGIQVANHIRKWKKVYKQIQGLKNISGALWDEETCTIRLEQQHYLSYVRDHREDAKYLNTPLENYHEMAPIFGNSLATGAYAKGSNEPLATEVTETENIIHDLEDGTTTNEKVGAETGGGDDVALSGNNNGAQSSGTKPPPAKKPKVIPVEDPNLALVTMMSENLGNLATAVVKLAEVVSSDDAVPPGLYEAMMSIPGFEEAHLEHYYAHLCEHPQQARSFYNLRLSNKMIWVAKYIKEHLSNVDM